VRTRMGMPRLCIRRSDNDARKKKCPENDRKVFQHPSPSVKSGATE
jgi:hypothetical protein